MNHSCENCKHFNKNMWNNICRDCRHHLGDNTNFEPMTNSDYIRSMSDEELADFIHLIVFKCTHNDCDECPFSDAEFTCPYENNGYKGCLNWLQEPRKVEEQ